MIHIQGFDSLKELHHPVISAEYQRRGMHMLIVDQPGAVGALRLHGLSAGHETEHYVAKLVDYVEGRDDVDSDRIRLLGQQPGRLLSPSRSRLRKAFEMLHRMGALWDFSVYFERAYAKIETAPSVPYMVSHGVWVMGQKTPEDGLAVARQMTLEGVADKITCPLLVAYGENDRQVPLWMAEKTIEAAVNSPNRKLKVFRLDEGGAEHYQIDNRQLIGDVMSDWAAEIFGHDPAGIA